MAIKMQRSQSMHVDRGFSLVEILIALAVLLLGITVVAQLFAHAVATNRISAQTSWAVLLVAERMETLKAIPLEDLAVGGSLDPNRPANGYWEYVSWASDGSMRANTADTRAPFLRIWRIDGAHPKTITVAVFSLHSPNRSEPLERARASTHVAEGF